MDDSALHTLPLFVRPEKCCWIASQAILITQASSLHLFAITDRTKLRCRRQQAASSVVVHPTCVNSHQVGGRDLLQNDWSRVDLRQRVYRDKFPREVLHFLVVWGQMSDNDKLVFLFSADPVSRTITYPTPESKPFNPEGEWNRLIRPARPWAWLQRKVLSFTVGFPFEPLDRIPTNSEFDSFDIYPDGSAMDNKVRSIRTTHAPVGNI